VVRDDSRIDPTRLLELIARGTGPLVVDVRSRREFRHGHVPGAINIPFWSLLCAPVPATLDDPIVVYCGHGPRAVAARRALSWRGFRRIALLSGHMSAWRTAGLKQEI
jgi:rhodanese-related sulfurtransferase